MLKGKRVGAAVLAIILGLVGTGSALYVFRSSLSIDKLYSALVKTSGICGRVGDFLGVVEAVRTSSAVAWAAQNSRRGNPEASGLVRWDTPYGGLWFPASTDAGFVFFTVAQYKVAAYPGVTIKPGDIVLDLGGFVGDWAKWAIEAGASKVVIAEPAPQQLECIRRNLASEIRDGRVLVYPKGVWDRDERLWLQRNQSNPAASFVGQGEGGAGEYVDLTTIDRMVAELNLQKIDVVKMDIEGAESRAIRGARETLSRFRPQLAVATEHTGDVLKNNRDVLEAVRQTAPFYKFHCGYCSVKDSGPVPETLYFLP